MGNPHRSNLGWSVLPRDTTTCWLVGFEPVLPWSEHQRTSPLRHSLSHLFKTLSLIQATINERRWLLFFIFKRSNKSMAYCWYDTGRMTCPPGSTYLNAHLQTYLNEFQPSPCIKLNVGTGCFMFNVLFSHWHYSWRTLGWWFIAYFSLSP